MMPCEEIELKVFFCVDDWGDEEVGPDFWLWSFNFQGAFRMLGNAGKGSSGL